MYRTFSKWLFLACLLSCAMLFVRSGAVIAAPQAANYRVLRRMPIGGEGGWDYLNVDPNARRLYVSRGDHVMVVDENSGMVVGDIPNTKGVHGIALATDIGRGFISDGGAMQVTVFDLKTNKTISEIPVTGQNPDWILYEPTTKRIFTFNGRSSNSTAINAMSGQVEGTVTLAGRPEEGAADGRGNIYVNLEDKSSLQEFDAKSFASKGVWSLAPCDGPSGIAIDTAHDRIFSACDKVMAITDGDSGKVVAAPPIGGDPDGAGFDPSSGLIFASCREGLLSVIHEDSPDKYSVLGNVMTQFGARTMTVDTKTHHVFTVTADFQAAPAPTPDNPRPRPQQIPNSFVILELGQ